MVRTRNKAGDDVSTLGLSSVRKLSGTELPHTIDSIDHSCNPSARKVEKNKMLRTMVRLIPGRLCADGALIWYFFFNQGILLLFFDPSIYSVYIQLVDESLRSDLTAVITSYFSAIGIWRAIDLEAVLTCQSRSIDKNKNKAIRGGTMLDNEWSVLQNSRYCGTSRGYCYEPW